MNEELNIEIEGNRIIRIMNKCLETIQIPNRIKKINGKEITPLTSYTIPTNVTKINDYCFANCKELTEIKGLEYIKEFKRGCFINCNKLNSNDLSSVSV